MPTFRPPDNNANTYGTDLFYVSVGLAKCETNLYFKHEISMENVQKIPYVINMYSFL